MNTASPTRASFTSSKRCEHFVGNVRRTQDMSLEVLLSRIEKGEPVSPADLLPYLTLGRKEQRANVNALLAAAYSRSTRTGDLKQAKIFIQRAWFLSGFSRELLPLYVQIYSALDDISGIRDACKRVGMMMASEGHLAEAISYFDLWQGAYQKFKNLDKYEFDFDIMEGMDRLAEPFRFFPRHVASIPARGKIRVAYLVKGMTHLGSILVRINLLYAQFHDRARVDPMFFAPESENTILASAAGKDHLERFQSHNCKVIMGPNACATEERLLAVAQSIYDAAPDVLVSSAALHGFEHYFITSLRPAPVVVGLVQGPPQQFAPPLLDWGIAWSKRPLMDSPVDCSPFKMAHDLPKRSEIVPHKRSELEVPEDACVLVTAGRHVKFQEPKFWQAMIDLLSDHPESYYLVLGVKESQIPFLSSMLSAEIGSRIRFLAWRSDDYLRSLCMGDIFIDTFPSGGGGVLVDAMALGIPIVSFRDNYMNLYDQTDWSPAEELINIPEIIVPRDDFEEMKRVVSRLIRDPENRRDLGKRCQAHVLATKGDSARAVRECEDLYFQIIEQVSKKTSVDPREAEVEKLKRRLARPRVPGWVARRARQLKRLLRYGERVMDRISEGRLASPTRN